MYGKPVTNREQGPCGISRVRGAARTRVTARPTKAARATDPSQLQHARRSTGPPSCCGAEQAAVAAPGPWLLARSLFPRRSRNPAFFPAHTVASVPGPRSQRAAKSATPRRAGHCVRCGGCTLRCLARRAATHAADGVDGQLCGRPPFQRHILGGKQEVEGTPGAQSQVLPLSKRSGGRSAVGMHVSLGRSCSQRAPENARPRSSAAWWSAVQVHNPCAMGAERARRRRVQISGRRKSSCLSGGAGVPVNK